MPTQPLPIGPKPKEKPEKPEKPGKPEEKPEKPEKPEEKPKKKTKKKTGKTKGPKPSQPTSFFFPDLHQTVLDAVRGSMPARAPPWFNPGTGPDDAALERTAVQSYDTNVQAQFTCDNRRCARRWGSGIVSVHIRGYANNGYNAVVYNQRCMRCKTLGKMTLDNDAYVERLAYRIKKWAGVKQETPIWQGKGGPPHEQALCEGCRRGHCPAGDNSARW